MDTRDNVDIKWNIRSGLNFRSNQNLRNNQHIIRNRNIWSNQNTRSNWNIRSDIYTIYIIYRVCYDIIKRKINNMRGTNPSCCICVLPFPWHRTLPWPLWGTTGARIDEDDIMNDVDCWWYDVGGAIRLNKCLPWCGWSIIYRNLLLDNRCNMSLRVLMLLHNMSSTPLSSILSYLVMKIKVRLCDRMTNM